MSKKGTCWFCGPSTMGEKPKLSPVHEHIWYYNHRYKTFSVSQGTSSALYLYKCNTYHYSDLFSVNKHFWSHLISSHLQHNVCSYFLGFFTERNGHGCAPTRGEAFRPSDLSSTNLRRPILSHLSVRTFISLSLSRFYLLLFGWWEMIIEKKKKMKRYRKLCWMNCSS